MTQEATSLLSSMIWIMIAMTPTVLLVSLMILILKKLPQSSPRRRQKGIVLGRRSGRTMYGKAGIKSAERRRGDDDGTDDWTSSVIIHETDSKPAEKIEASSGWRESFSGSRDDSSTDTD